MFQAMPPSAASQGSTSTSSVALGIDEWHAPLVDLARLDFTDKSNPGSASLPRRPQTAQALYEATTGNRLAPGQWATLPAAERAQYVLREKEARLRHDRAFTTRLVAGTDATLIPPTGAALSAPGVRSLICPANAGFILAGGVDQKVRLWDVAAPEASHVIGDLVWPGPVRAGARGYHLDRTRGVDTVVEVYSPPDARQLRGLSPAAAMLASRQCDHTDVITALDLVLSGAEPLLISGARDGVIKVWK